MGLRLLGLLGLVALVVCGPELASSDTSKQAGSDHPLWQKFDDGGRPGVDSPHAGEDGELVYDRARHRVLVVGGKDDSEHTTNEVWALDLETRKWSQVATKGPQPQPREDHSVILDPVNDQLILFGGDNGPTIRDAWALSLSDNRWTEITRDSTPARQDHTATYDPVRQRMIVIGGDEESTDVWALDLNRDSNGHGDWTRLATGEPNPGTRNLHAAAYDSRRDRIYVYAGRVRLGRRHRYLGDLWALDLKSERWTELDTKGSSPTAIVQTVLSYDPEADELIAFGGEVVVPRDGDISEYLTNSVWVLDLQRMTWKARSPYPQPVYDHAGVFAPEYGGIILYGGQSHNPGKEHSTWLLRNPKEPSD